DLADPGNDPFQRLPSIERLRLGAFGQRLGLAHGGYRLRCAATYGGNQLLDFAGRVLRAVRQRPYLVSDHSEATPLLPSARRFNSGVERQQVGLLGNAANNLEHITNVTDL